jgi:hypothetical protein
MFSKNAMQSSGVPMQAVFITQIGNRNTRLRWPLPALMAARGLTDGIASNHGSQIKENIETRADAAKH